ncbi:hypothetical protein [Lysinibacillus endophyticus]|nr:hypothetical protein [Lysinibacillus endophyticus]MCP1143379.1 hypothetical protein [Lysinibacillus endophyticus]
MTSLLLSKFETYLLDEEQEQDSRVELEFETKEQLVDVEEYPQGFFSSL